MAGEDRRFYYQLLEMRGEFRCTTPYASVTAYREAEDYVPASQVLGLLLAIRLVRASRRNSSTLDVLEEVYNVARNYMEKGGVAVKVWPGVPVREGEPLALLEAVYHGLRLRGLYRLAEFVRDKVIGLAWRFPYVLGLVPAPRIKIPKDEEYPRVKGKRIPLILAVMPFLLTEALKAGVSGRIAEIVKSLQETSIYRYSQGICVDRVRHTSRHGMFYAYGWFKTVDGVTVCPLVEYKSPAEPLASDSEIETYAPILSLGYKKAYNSRKVKVSVKRPELRLAGDGGRDQGKRLFDVLVDLAREAVDTLSSDDEVAVGLEAVDYVPHALLVNLVEDGGGKRRPNIMDLMIKPVLYYLQITNSLYRVYIGGKPAPPVMSGSTVGFTVEDVKSGVEMLEGFKARYEETDKILGGAEVRRVGEVNEARVTSNKLLSLLRFKLMTCGTAVIPFIYVHRRS